MTAAPAAATVVTPVAPAVALRALAVLLGVFFLAMGANKLEWIADGQLLAARFERWLPDASPYARLYLETVAQPGVALFARLVPLGELAAGVALVTGVGVRLAAAAAFVMVLNFHVATSAFSSWDFLRDGTGLPVLGGLLALALAGGRLPFSIPLPRRVMVTPRTKRLARSEPLAQLPE